MNRRPTSMRVALPVLILCLSFILIPDVFADTTYVVQPGDTLFRIALNHGLTTHQLAQANGITNYDFIYAGQVLTIPGGSQEADSATAAAQAVAPPASAVTYVVQRGDMLSRIAQRNGISTHILAQANGITNYDIIYAGQTLTIPGSSAPRPAVAAAGVGGGERWIDVNLSTQSLTAFEGNTPVYNTAISSGTWAHPTVTGQFNIYLRYESQAMNGYRLGYDYYLPNVPYVMYFYRDYSLHGTYWHSNFGTPMSHGCVNLPTPAAQWLYNWSSYGTRVNIHY